MSKVPSDKKDKDKDKDKEKLHGTAKDKDHKKRAENVIPIMKVRDMEASGASSIKYESYFHGFIPEYYCCKLLRNVGDFLVRQVDVTKGSGSCTEQFVISYRSRPRMVFMDVGGSSYADDMKAVTWKSGLPPAGVKKYDVDDGIEHMNIRYSRRARLYYVNYYGFSLASGLIAYHQRHRIFVNPKDSSSVIITPIPRASWQLNHEQITRAIKLGDGAFGEVFLGFITLGYMKRVKVAVKTMTEVKTAKDYEELFEEAMRMQMLKHRNVVQLVGIATNEHPVMMAMECCPGGSVLSAVKKNRSMPQWSRIHYCLGAAEGLAFLAQNRVIHRDIAARNVLIGENNVVKISDFGMSREGGTIHVKQMQNVPVRYLAPESLRNGVFSLATDVYTYGVYVWEVFNDGKEPYTGISTQRVKKLITSGERMGTGPKMPIFMWNIVLRCWRHMEHQRPSMADIIQLIKQPSSADVWHEMPTSSQDPFVVPTTIHGITPKQVSPHEHKNTIVMETLPS